VRESITPIQPPAGGTCTVRVAAVEEAAPALFVAVSRYLKPERLSSTFAMVRTDDPAPL
jgi:hypothetical protein